MNLQEVIFSKLFKVRWEHLHFLQDAKRNDFDFNCYLYCCNFYAINVNPLSANITKWSNTLKQFVGKLRTNCLSVLDHFVVLALKGLKYKEISIYLKMFYSSI